MKMHLKKFSQQERLILQTISATLEGHISLKELHVTLIGAGLSVSPDALRAALGTFVANGYARYEMVAGEGHYFITTKGAKLIV
jgi:hypothetical protein